LRIPFRYIHIDTFLQINDQINTVLNRYEAFKKGDYVTSSNPIPAELGGRSSGNNNNDLSLIDLDESLSPKPKVGSSMTTTQDELAALFGPSLASSNPPVPPPAMGMMGFSAPQAFAAPIPSTNLGMGMNVNRMAMGMPPSGTPPLQPQLGSIMLPGTPQPVNAIASYIPQRPQSQPEASQAAKGSEGKDPFADLVELF
jgi:ADP-ribosylation factor-binding protein GGA